MFFIARERCFLTECIETRCSATGKVWGDEGRFAGGDSHWLQQEEIQPLKQVEPDLHLSRITRECKRCCGLHREREMTKKGCNWIFLGDSKVWLDLFYWVELILDARDFPTMWDRFYLGYNSKRSRSFNQKQNISEPQKVASKMEPKSFPWEPKWASKYLKVVVLFMTHP